LLNLGQVIEDHHDIVANKLQANKQQWATTFIIIIIIIMSRRSSYQNFHSIQISETLKQHFT
jgi:hypothetical protein